VRPDLLRVQGFNLDDHLSVSNGSNLDLEDSLSAAPCEPQLEADPARRDLTPAEATLCRHALELFTGVGTLQQAEPKNPPSQESIPGRQVHVTYFGIDVLEGGVLPEVVDRRLTAWLQDSVHLVEGANRVGEVLERRHADDQVE